MKFKTLYADPPWKFNDRLDPTRRLKYPVLSMDELLNLPVEMVMDDNSHFYLWSTASHIHEALHLMAKWEFVYKTIIPWVKLTKHGRVHFGMGHYFRASHELCLFGVRGKLKTATNNTRNVLIAKRPSIHSGKPEEMYELIEANSPSPYLELFSRNTRPEWTMLGYDVDRRDVRESIQDLIE